MSTIVTAWMLALTWLRFSVPAPHGGASGGAREEVAQIDRDRHQLGAVHVEERREPGVPEGHRVEQHHGRDDRLGQRQHDPQQDAVGAEAVDLRGLLQLRRQALEEGLHHQQVEDADRVRQGDGPHAVLQPEAGDQDVVGDEAAGEEHGEHGDPDERAPALEVVLGQDVGVAGGQHHGDGGGDDRVEDGVAVVPPEHRVGEDDLVGGEVEALGPQRHVTGADLLLAAERAGDDVHERVQRDQHDQGEDHAVDALEDAVSPGGADGAHHRLVPTVRRDSWLAEVISTRPMTASNRPMAAA